MLHFVHERLLPQDAVAVMAWNRATDFTTDHARIAAVLERFKRTHEGVEAKLNLRFSGLARLYGSRDIPSSLQRDIDAVFGEADGGGARPAVMDLCHGPHAGEPDGRPILCKSVPKRVNHDGSHR